MPTSPPKGLDQSEKVSPATQECLDRGMEVAMGTTWEATVEAVVMASPEQVE